MATATATTIVAIKKIYANEYKTHFNQTAEYETA